MSIRKTSTGMQVDEFLPGTVVAVRTFRAQRNTSDTMDYSDYRIVSVTEALVHVGANSEHHPYEWERGKALQPHERLQWCDLSNYMSWRTAYTYEVTVDALLPEAVQVDYDAYLEHEAHAAYDRQIKEEVAVREAAEAEAKKPLKGRTCKVVRGRKVPQGTTGVSVWYGADKWDKTRMRVGLKLASGEIVWTAASNVEAIPET